MFELLVAYVLYITDADEWWWFGFIAFLLVDFINAVHKGYKRG
jgi:hypothetical protein